MDVYRKDRQETLINYAGSRAWGNKMGVKADKRILGNLIQQQGQAHAIVLAYNDPRYFVLPNVPDVDHIAVRLDEWLARYVPMIGLGDIGRGIALDSYFGFGILKVGQGILPAAARIATGQTGGPMCWRVSQDNFGFDGDARNWSDVGYQWDMTLVPLDDAKSFEPFLAYNPDDTLKLAEFVETNESTTSRIQNVIHGHSAQAMTRLVTFYFPGTNLEAIWPANDYQFGKVVGKPLLVRPYTGHHTGPFGVLSHLDIPDNLLPIAQCESTKGLHYLYNELVDITSNQALEARANPTYEVGAERDIERWENAKDRKPIPVSNTQRHGLLTVPGPDPSQTAYMAATHAMFKEFSSINMDDVLGLAPTAGTARQSELIRQSTTIRAGEARRKMNRIMEMAARKLCHLALNDPQMEMAARRQIPRTNLSVDVSWLNPSKMPRNGSVEDYKLTIIDGSMEYRSAMDRLASLKEASAEIMAAAQAVAMGVPLDLERFIETQAKYRDLPELREWYVGALPQYAESRAAAGGSIGPARTDKPNGDYTRTSVSERTNQGGLMQALTQVPTAGQPAAA
jgi:hypothetical protein